MMLMKSLLRGAAAIVLSVGINGWPAAHGENSIPRTSSNSSTNPTLDSLPFEESPSARMRSKVVLFVTNRAVNERVEDKARRENKTLAYEDLFLNAPDVGTTYGMVKVSYPSNRKRGQQTYGWNSSWQNPLFDFSIVDHRIVRTPGSFRELAARYFAEGTGAMMYVHGLDNSFSDGAERIAQLAVDLKRPEIPIFFSWPSDSGRIFRNIPRFGISENAYKETQRISAASRSYMVHVMDHISIDMGNPFYVIAHSMGTELATSSLILREAQTSMGMSALGNVPGPSALILAAPDISRREFETSMRPRLLESSKKNAIYCSYDYALIFSKYYNRSDDRLGFCTDARASMAGADLVAVRGDIEDFARHSYYLSSPKILNDIEDILGGSVLLDISQTGRTREIWLP